MSDFIKRYFGPLTKESCVYFLFLSVFFFFVLIFTIIGEIVFLVKHSNQLTFARGVSGVLLLFNGFIAYFSNRLLYTMCKENYLQ
jgi:hypothetical protein